MRSDSEPSGARKWCRRPEFRIAREKFATFPRPLARRLLMNKAYLAKRVVLRPDEVLKKVGRAQPRPGETDADSCSRLVFGEACQAGHNLEMFDFGNLVGD